ncbi:hypothetical protein EVAR_53711_1 [Eumeta japonica]|uniref:Uncharacterized protein n=1 Tax=Eumeta variegata TaxID=151549 RepID=A0A4C1Z3W4_EUMVA|nr:hypothetical protein EVAR_53711_1 [Eumeta japonica]
MSPHFKLLKCRRLGTAATADVQSALVRPPRRSPAAACVRRRAPTRCRRRGACPDVVGTIALIANRCCGRPLADWIDHPDEGQSEIRGQRLADACCCCWMHG